MVRGVLSLAVALTLTAATAEVRLDGESLARLPAGVVAHPSIRAVPAGDRPALAFSEGGFTIPTAGNLSAVAGTVDLRLRTPATWPLAGDLALFHTGTQAHYHVTLLVRAGGIMAVYKGGEAHFSAINYGASRRWSPESWHRVQFSWQAAGELVNFLLVVDGQLVGSAEGRLVEPWPPMCTVGVRGTSSPWQGMLNDIVLSPTPYLPPELRPGRRTLLVDATRELGECYRFWRVGNFNQPHRFTDPAFWQATRRERPFTHEVNAVYLLGGRYADQSVWYRGLSATGELLVDFSGLIAQLKTLLEAGFTPWIVLDNVPYAMSDPPQENTYGNTAPPADEQVWHRYVTAAVNALVEAFGRETVAGWWFRVGTEPDLQPGHWAGTKEQWLRHYDFTVDAVTRVLPEARIGPGNILNPAGGEFGSRTEGLWGLDIIDHAALGTNRCSGQQGTRLDWFSYSWYGRVGQPLSVFDQAASMVRERLRRYPALAERPVIIGEYAVLHDEAGRRLWSGDSTEWAASFQAAVADRVYRHNIQQVNEWGQTSGGLPHPRAQVLTMLEAMAGGRRLTVEAGGDSTAESGAIACRREDQLHLLVYNHRPLRRPKVTEQIALTIRDPQLLTGQRWRLTTTPLDAAHGVWAYAYEADCQAAGLRPEPTAGRYEGSLRLVYGQPGVELFFRNIERYRALGELRGETQEVAITTPGELTLEFALPGHGIRWLTLTPPG
ncbi:MAG: hypothetical protein HUU35_09075 [Armatimonadetes bacterium]|nr:hypothetical protein [Armatimonadota bacterium]